MTTRVTVKNEDDSNPAQELVVVVHNPANLLGKGPVTVLKRGESADWWMSNQSAIIVTERPASP